MHSLALLFSVLLGAAAMGYGAVYGLSEMKLRAVTRPPPFDHPIDTDAATVRRGQHIARTRGCFGCHGQQLQGAVFSEEWEWVDRAVAPNLVAHAKQHDAATLEAAIRHGIGHDGRALWSMPSYNYAHLADGDVAALIAFLQTAPVIDKELPSPSLGFEARWAIVTGAQDHMARWVTDVPPLRRNRAEDPGLVRGEYLAMTTCNECHGLDLRGAKQQDFATPDLAIVAGYPEADFRKLMKEGRAMGGRDDLGLMTMVSKDRFAHFTDQELTDLYHFLRTLGDEAAPEGVPWRSLP